MHWSKIKISLMLPWYFTRYGQKKLWIHHIVICLSNHAFFWSWYGYSGLAFTWIKLKHTGFFNFTMNDNGSRGPSADFQTIRLTLFFSFICFSPKKCSYLYRHKINWEISGMIDMYGTHYMLWQGLTLYIDNHDGTQSSMVPSTMIFLPEPHHQLLHEIWNGLNHCIWQNYRSNNINT